jgi:hypothetical protein
LRRWYSKLLSKSVGYRLYIPFSVIIFSVGTIFYLVNRREDFWLCILFTLVLYSNSYFGEILGNIFCSFIHHYEGFGAVMDYICIILGYGIAGIISFLLLCCIGGVYSYLTEEKN